MQPFIIEDSVRVEDGIGGYIETWVPYCRVYGYLDMLTGSDINNTQNAIVEESTHILIVPEFKKGITDNMRVVDRNDRFYTITYSDDPVGQGHHNEVYIKFGGVL